ncbi:MAG TPA: hypothetical protein VHM27_13820 [Rhizomicrobium sp.]|nr:hypothetical protein [Rhizomicrobium sp.]
MNRRTLLLASLVVSPMFFASAWAHNGVDHGAYHGGVVRPYKELHFEAVVLPAGGVQLYFSDKMGEPLPASTVSQVAAEVEYSGGKVETVDMAIDPTGVFWAGKSAPLADSKAVLRIGFTFRGAPATVELPGAALIAAAKKGPPKKATGKKVADGHH